MQNNVAIAELALVSENTKHQATSFVLLPIILNGHPLSHMMLALTAVLIGCQKNLTACARSPLMLE